MTDETTFHNDTVPEVRRLLESLRASGDRVRIWFGDTTTGRAWPEENMILGYIGRSSGRLKVPLLIHNQRSTGGPHLLDHCIVRIDRISNGKTLYRHPGFSAGKWQFTDDQKTGQFAILHNGEFFGLEPSYKRAQNLCDFMRGNRYAK